MRGTAIALAVGAAVLGWIGLAGAKARDKPPEGAEPPDAARRGEPTPEQLARASSGRMYHVRMWPDVGAGIWTVARLAGSAAWVAFERVADRNVPRKTNVNDPALLAQMRADWQLPG